ncbi:gluconate 2-dehydrogenase subunit 3 family protein [Sphingobium sp. HBC34]|uniref:Gluconate 2-dehydrogenase subunit 3 family protein n=1 Tax=Sphingobium cyanobacteriorum TaxID=3063954 RepID=A0ABT8ZR02_9SPHN|nr:gluconate 2-dehydrogenase subunit 3 family protein [Sphingobium sp. HBC34]MDO7836632.1 gluconate 2-dehydrogenase subunit 3 family protein [Sphingobium sp. HBC34]
MIDIFSIDRRAAMAQIAALLGTASLPVEAFASPAAEAKGLLTAARLATLSAIADTVIPATDTPGAVGAAVPQQIDRMLASWASVDTRVRVTGVIADIDALALKAKGRGFAALDAGARQSLLLPYDRDSLAPDTTAVVKSSGVLGILLPPPVVNPGWLTLKGLVLSLYYISEIGMTQEQVYEHVPGAWVPSLKITPGMRPYASGGLF